MSSHWEGAATHPSGMEREVHQDQTAAKLTASVSPKGCAAAINAVTAPSSRDT